MIDMPHGSQRSEPELSVVVATYNRGDAVARLLAQLAGQTLAPSRFEVVVVDDGSTPPVAERLAGLAVPFRLTVAAQANAGPGAARGHAVALARAPLLVVVDDDMCVAPDFLERHLAAHPAGSRRAVLGPLRAAPGARLPLFERLGMVLNRKMVDEVAGGVRAGRGTDVYTGNVSLRRADYEAVGGFDPAFRLSEDLELGVRLERSGVEIGVCPEAAAEHASDHTSLGAWMRRSRAYGAADARVAAKHAGDAAVDPWRFLFAVSPVSRPLLLLAAFAPAAVRPVAWLAIRVALLLDALRLEGPATAGATLVYGLQYYAGVRDHAGGRGAAWGGLRRYLNGVAAGALPPAGRVLKCAADVCEDHAAIRRSDAKYKPAGHKGAPADGAGAARLLGDLVQKVGFQMMAAYRVMRLLRDLRLTLLAKVASRLIRHLYAAELHWDAELAPGVVLVHGTGLVVGHAARVGPGCILFQHVTLGESIHPERREIGTPTLEADVHVGPGATLLGPITVGRGSKVAAGAVLMRSVPDQSLVEMAATVVRPRRPGAPPARRPASGRDAPLPILAGVGDPAG